MKELIDKAVDYIAIIGIVGLIIVTTIAFIIAFHI